MKQCSCVIVGAFTIIIAVFSVFLIMSCLTSCSLSLIQTDTHGQASDVVEEAQKPDFNLEGSYDVI